jgi:membrane-associated phospholipid phosphatase
VSRRRRFEVAALATSLLVFLLLAVAVHPSSATSLDAAVKAAVEAHRTPTLTGFFSFYTRLGSWLPLTLATLVVAAVLPSRGRRRAAVFVIAALVTSIVANVLLKYLFERPRPDVADAVVQARGYAFPSGHAMESATFALALIVVAWPTRWRWPTTLLAGTFAVLMGISRIYLGVHWLTDVLAGWAMAVAVVCAVLLVVESFAGPISAERRSPAVSRAGPPRSPVGRRPRRARARRATRRDPG